MGAAVESGINWVMVVVVMAVAAKFTELTVTK